MKIVRTDAELEMPRLDTALRAAGHQLVLLAEGVSEEELARELADAELLLMCYTRIDAKPIAGASRLKGHRQVRRRHRRHRHSGGECRGMSVRNVQRDA